MDNIWIVLGSTGEYSDHCEWAIAAYTDQAMAEEHVVQATAAADALVARYPHYYDIPKGANPFDADMRVDYTGVRYTLWQVPLRAALPIPAS